MKKETYARLLNQATLSVVRHALGKAASGTECNIFITFATDMPGVVISPDLQQKYPSQMSIVLHNQFNQLRVMDDKFSVCLSFSGVEQEITITFNSLLYFLDKNCSFDLSFKPQYHDKEENIEARAQSSKIIMLSKKKPS